MEFNRIKRATKTTAIRVASRMAPSVSAAAATLLIMALVPMTAHAFTLDMPIVDDLACGFIDFVKNKLVIVIAAGVLLFSLIGHWLGTSKIWIRLMDVGIGMGAIFAICGVLAKYGKIGGSCMSAIAG